MRRYLATRLLLAIPTIIAVTILVFLAMRVLPGDPLVVMFGFEGFGRLSDDDRAGSTNSWASRSSVGTVWQLDEGRIHP